MIVVAEIIIGAIIFLPTLFCAGYLIYLICQTFIFRSITEIKSSDLFVTETIDVPNYEPAIMGYLVNYQKIGRREICSTLFDLISRNVIEFDLKKGLVTDDYGEYVLKRKDKDKELMVFEKELIIYLFGVKKEINQDDLKHKLYKGNLDNNFYKSFLRNIQLVSKQNDFFSEKMAKFKSKTYAFISKVTTIMATVASFFFGLSLQLLEEADSDVLGLIIVFLIVAVILWVIKFLVSYFYNLTCYYNSFSKKGNEDYKRWIGFKKYLKNWSSLKDQPMMGIKTWERYYAYSIGLKCSKKFFKQIKKMKIMDNSIDVNIIETFNFMVDNIGTSVQKVKAISIDEFGGSHVDY